MENKDAIELIKKVALFIEGNELTKDSFEQLINECDKELNKNTLLELFKKNQFDTKQYPKLNITIGCDKEGNIIQSDIKSLESISDKNFDKLTEHVEKSDDVYLKLLYSIAWKKGDLSKLTSIINGIINNTDSESKTGIVFNAFGKHLRDRNNPIIDQHVIRAFLAIEHVEDRYKEHGLEYIMKLPDNFINKNKGEIEKYQEWLNNLSQKEIHKNNKEDFFYYADQILFTLGKTIKSK